MRAFICGFMFCQVASFCRCAAAEYAPEQALFITQFASFFLGGLSVGVLMIWNELKKRQR